MHHVHHGAKPEHMNKNLGITGGLILWDYLFHTLYWTKPGEEIIWGASMQELGENNPHKTLRGFVAGPFIAAVQVLRGRAAVPAVPSRIS
jgi:sterol desaturase/sphingolipid hydroxylase (fatty acid hydroxylase superfamily)